MKTNKLLVAAVLVTAIGAPIAGFVGDVKMPQQTTYTGLGLPFLHGYPTDQIASQSDLASLERANEWLNSPPLTATRPFPSRPGIAQFRTVPPSRLSPNG
jgi:hypothetical protein